MNLSDWEYQQRRQWSFPPPHRGLCYARGNIFDGGHTLIVIPTNCRGVLGAGLALWAKQAWPRIASSQASLARRGELHIGEIEWYSISGDLAVVTLPTKIDWRDDSRLEYIDLGLRALVARLLEATELWASYHVGVPALGCGRGKLPWAEVDRLLTRHLNQIDVTHNHRITLYHPAD